MAGRNQMFLAEFESSLGYYLKFLSFPERSISKLAIIYQNVAILSTY
jgi:hypothetical protein